MANLTTNSFPLNHPFDFKGDRVTEVTLRRPKGREIRAMQNGKASQIDRSFELMANLAEREVGLFDDMDAADIRQVDVWLNEILGE